MKTRFILINTSHAGNVGATARAMKVMGFDELYLVAPRWANVLRREETIQRSSGAHNVLENTKIVATLDEALDIADNTIYALTGGLYSRSPQNIARVRHEMRVGNLYINRKITGAIVDRQPFGGARMSGVGSKAGGPDYLLQFLVPRTITESVMRRGFAPTED